MPVIPSPAARKSECKERGAHDRPSSSRCTSSRCTSVTSVPIGLKRIGRGLRNRLARLNNERVVRGQRLYNYAPTPSLVTDVTPVHRASVPAIDVHNHLGCWLNGGR